MSWTDRILHGRMSWTEKPVQGPDDYLRPGMEPAKLEFPGPDHSRAPRREILKGLVEKGALTPNEANKAWNSSW